MKEDLPRDVSFVSLFEHCRSWHVTGAFRNWHGRQIVFSASCRDWLTSVKQRLRTPFTTYFARWSRKSTCRNPRRSLEKKKRANTEEKDRVFSLDSLSTQKRSFFEDFFFFSVFILCKFLCTISRPVHRHKYSYGACPSAGHVASTAAETSFPPTLLVTVEFIKHIRSPWSQKTNIFQRRSGFPRVAHPIPVLSVHWLAARFFASHKPSQVLRLHFFLVFGPLLAICCLVYFSEGATFVKLPVVLIFERLDKILQLICKKRKKILVAEFLLFILLVPRV